MSLRVALYARVSTDRQAQAQTIDQQITRLGVATFYSTESPLRQGIG
jgi:DNA invertase Pin-like site-specific DNA recombinase